MAEIAAFALYVSKRWMLLASITELPVYDRTAIGVKYLP